MSHPGHPDRPPHLIRLLFQGLSAAMVRRGDVPVRA
jgi:hypothetical protein